MYAGPGVTEKSGSLRTFKKERAQEIQTKAGKSSLTITKVSRKPKKTYAPGFMT